MGLGRRLLVFAMLGQLAILEGGAAMAPRLSEKSRGEITAAVKAYEQSWNSSDLDAMAALYSPDIHWVNVRGMHWRGLEEVDRAHRVYFQIMFKGVRNDLEAIESIMPVAADVAVAVVIWKHGAFVTPAGHKAPPTRTRMSLVYLHTPQGWKIAHGHNEDIDEAAQRFDPIRGEVLKGVVPGK